MADWFVRKGGSDSNGGSSASLTPDRSGSDMGTTNNSTQVTSATGAFTAGDVGKGISVNAIAYRIAAFTNSTTIQLDRNFSGTGTNRSWAIGGALLTINKVTNVAVTSVWQAGDTVYIGAGTYREIPAFGMSFVTTPLTLQGDVDGSKTGDPGEIQITAYLTNNKTAPSTLTLFDMSAVRNFWHFRNLVLVGGNGPSPKAVRTGDSTNVTFTDCAVIAVYPTTNTAISHVTTTATAKNILWDRCYILADGAVNITLPTVTGADYNVNIIFRNCMIDMISNGNFTVSSSGALANFGGGVKLFGSFFRTSVNPMFSTAASISTTFPCQVEGCVLMGGVGTSVGLNANTAGQITERNNLFNVGTPRTNVTAGTGSVSDFSYLPLYHFGQEAIWGGRPRPFTMPTESSGLVGFGTSPNVPATDILKAARPAGGGSSVFAVGAFERANTFIRETTTVQSGASGLKCVGPGYQDFLVPVDAVSTTISVYLRYDSTYAGTRPQFSVLNGGECGVVDASVTVSTSGLNAFSQVSLNFTPTAKGIVTARLISSDTNGAGAVFADTFAVV